MPKLLDRLVTELKNKGIKEPYGIALKILHKNGYIDYNGELTDKGRLKEMLPAGTKGLGGYTNTKDYLYKRLHSGKH